MIKKKDLNLLIMSNNLAECEKYVFRNIDYADEVILILTDKNIKAPKYKNMKVYYYPWEDNFSAPLNFGITKCTKKWILRLDSDEFIEPFYFNKLYKLIDPISYDYYMMFILSFLDDPYENPDNTKSRLGTITRLWKNKKSIEFEGLIHEQVTYSVQKNKLRGGIIDDIKIYHFGEIGRNKDIQAKESKNYRKDANYYYLLATKQLDISPTNAGVYEHIFQYYFCFKRYKEALKSIEKACYYCAPEMLFKYLSMRETVLRQINKKLG